MPEYRFGREVTVKLPEPTCVDADSAYWEAEGVGRVTIYRKPPGYDYAKDRFVQKNLGLALAILAARDYAEGGEA